MTQTDEASALWKEYQQKQNSKEKLKNIAVFSGVFVLLIMMVIGLWIVIM